jgi:hypothetical protein
MDKILENEIRSFIREEVDKMDLKMSDTYTRRDVCEQVHKSVDQKLSAIQRQLWGVIAGVGSFLVGLILVGLRLLTMASN